MHEPTPVPAQQLRSVFNPFLILCCYVSLAKIAPRTLCQLHDQTDHYLFTVGSYAVFVVRFITPTFFGSPQTVHYVCSFNHCRRCASIWLQSCAFIVHTPVLLNSALPPHASFRTLCSAHGCLQYWFPISTISALHTPFCALIYKAPPYLKMQQNRSTSCALSRELLGPASLSSCLTHPAL